MPARTWGCPKRSRVKNRPMRRRQCFTMSGTIREIAPWMNHQKNAPFAEDRLPSSVRTRAFERGPVRSFPEFMPENFCWSRGRALGMAASGLLRNSGSSLPGAREPALLCRSGWHSLSLDQSAGRVVLLLAAILPALIFGAAGRPRASADYGLPWRRPHSENCSGWAAAGDSAPSLADSDHAWRGRSGHWEA